MTSEDIWNQASETKIDKVIGDEDAYLLMDELGHGSYGCLFLAQLLKNGKYFAVKRLCKNGLNEDELELQRQEIDIQQSLDHPYLLGLHQVIEEDHYTYLIMDLCEQGDLFDYVDDGVDNAHCHVLYSQILEAIEHMHEKDLYHRDIKLENVLLHEDGSIKVADFGLATKERFSSEFGCGSTTFLGPEHFPPTNDRSRTCDAAASDVWSLGIVLLALLFGRNPWQEASDKDADFSAFKRDPLSLRKLFPDLSPEYMEFLQKVLAIDPAQRVSISEMKVLFSNMKKPNYEKQRLSPVHIHSIDNASYDSAIFSQVDGASWSDLDEKDRYDQTYGFEDIKLDTKYEETMFINKDEEELWWRQPLE
ncbi:kinase-like domain-containing protein [Parasitella parasitica]|nr:kinase-like domain-containing protein [Parasitella parasitica]